MWTKQCIAIIPFLSYFPPPPPNFPSIQINANGESEKRDHAQKGALQNSNSQWQNGTINFIQNLYINIQFEFSLNLYYFDYIASIEIGFVVCVCAIRFTIMIFNLTIELNCLDLVIVKLKHNNSVDSRTTKKPAEVRSIVRVFRLCICATGVISGMVLFGFN